MNNFAYIRNTYGVPVRRLGRVTYNGNPGIITSATHYVWIRLDGEKHPRPYHPKSDGLVYLEGRKLGG